MGKPGTARGTAARAAAALVVLTSCASAAYAQEARPRPEAYPRVFGEAEIDLFAKRYFRLPSPTLVPPSDASLRVGTTARLGEGVTLAGVGGGFGMAFGDRWLMPIMRFEFATAVGTSPRVQTSADGAIAEMHPWTAKNVALHFFGFGVRGKHRRWMAEASVMPGLAVTWMDASIAQGDRTATTTALLITMSIRAELVGCRRLDPESRLCISLSPLIYEHGFMNGGSLGLRWEVGP